MGVAILVSEILLLSKMAKKWPKKFNRLELAQKNYASRGQCIEHAHQF